MQTGNKLLKFKPIASIRHSFKYTHCNLPYNETQPPPVFLHEWSRQKNDSQESQLKVPGTLCAQLWHFIIISQIKRCRNLRADKTQVRLVFYIKWQLRSQQQAPRLKDCISYKHCLVYGLNAFKTFMFDIINH